MPKIPQSELQKLKLYTFIVQDFRFARLDENAKKQNSNLYIRKTFLTHLFCCLSLRNLERYQSTQFYFPTQSKASNNKQARHVYMVYKIQHHQRNVIT